MRHVCLKSLICDQPAPRVRLNACSFKVQRINCAGAPNRIVRLLGLNNLAAFQRYLDPAATSIINALNRLHGFSKPERDAIVAHFVDQLVNNFLIDEIQQ